MPIVATPESGIPLPFDTTPEELNDFRDKARALFETLKATNSEVEITEEDQREAHRIMAVGEIPPVRTISPGAIANLEAILNEYDREVLDVHTRLRNYVTNKLILETVDPDAKIRLRALELLGKTTGVGAFSERVDVNVTHRTVQDIEAEIKKTLEAYTDYTDAEIEEPPGLPEPSPVALVELDVDAELGLTPDAGS